MINSWKLFESETHSFFQPIVEVSFEHRRLFFTLKTNLEERTLCILVNLNDFANLAIITKNDIFF
jgi:hypothetical protein